ncbi:MAG: 1-deoxy-D-xylulose-5-phosphate reductoisomerase [Pseudomonadota bacterium]
MAVRKISIIGATGSVGTSAASVIDYANAAALERVFEVDALVAGRDVKGLVQQVKALGARHAVIADEDRYSDLKEALSGQDVTCAAGKAAVYEAAARPVDRVLAAVVGIAGLPSTFAAIEAGNSVALANKESMVCAGPMLNALAMKNDVKIVPTDSEHNAMFQVMEQRKDVEKLILTASGGPFRKTPRAELYNVTPDLALAHPRWDMGRKISIDSATLFNKGLELIEAAYLFDMPEAQIDVVVHPQSIVHSLVAYRDGSVLAQMGEPDMRTPILHALTWPDRRQPGPAKRLDLATLGQLDFEALDGSRFRSVDLCREALRAGGGAPTVLNCANEAAVAAFLAGQCGFVDIEWIVAEALSQFSAGVDASNPLNSLDAVLALDADARLLAQDLVKQAALRREGV